ncbi:MAG TPA: PEP-CTERM sorting domain-containing protein [Planctomycetota bacterium]|nr:PEP-CTERM sorting domain-containing protein [Planctomycetota bacterium]
MDSRTLVACLAIAMLLVAAEAQAELICSFQQPGGEGHGAIFTSAVIGFGGADNIDEWTSVPLLFDETPRTTADIGTIFTATDADLHFAPVVTRLANGIDGLVVFKFGNSGSAGWESVFLPLKGYNPPNGIDFQGCVIDTITMTIDTLTFDTPGEDPNQDGVWTNMTATITIEIYGTAVPEPATMTLLSAGALGLVGFIRRQRRK